MRAKIIMTGAATATLLVAACTTTDPYTGQQVRNNTGTGAIAGAVGGAILGYLTNTSNSEQGRRNALIGAGVGALAGAAVGNYMDRQQAALREQLADTGVQVIRQGDDLYLRMPGDLTFAVNDASIRPDLLPLLDDVARVLNEYNQTTIDVIGHTDSTGNDTINQPLSERRASSVAQYLISRNVLRERFYVAGMSSREPIASNATAEGRQQNRRVEIKIAPLRG